MNFYANHALCVFTFSLVRNGVTEGDSGKQAGTASKLFRYMKLTAFIILITCLQTSATGVAQQTITFSGKEVSLENVFAAIKKQTNYKFFFNIESIQHARTVTIEVKNASIEQVLAMALKDQPFTYTIKGRTIFIIQKKEEDKSSSLSSVKGDPVTVTGRVTDDQGQPLVGANIKIKGTNIGVTTDKAGVFKLTNVDENATLEISFVGHETQVVAVKGKAFLTINLAQKLSLLDETQVIAYGTTTRRLATGNVTSIKASDIEKQPVQNPLLALQGRVPSLNIVQETGIPGGGITVRIQGQNSISSGNDPLIIIDGVPYPSENLTTNQGSSILGNSSLIQGMQGSTGSPLSYINSSDIESIEILKDADATAIYGSRAANGAILINTKKGKAGQTRINLNIQQGFGKVAHFLDLMNSQQYLEMRREGKNNDGEPILSSDYDLNGLWDTTRYTDWQKVLIGGTSQYGNYNVNISGGSSTIQYLVGSTYHDETTVFPGHFADKKGGIHFNLTSVTNSQRLRFQLSGSYTVDKNHLPGVDLTNDIFLAPVAPPLYKDDGTLNWAPDPNSNGNSSWDNPLARIYNIFENKATSLVSNAIIGYQIIPGLEIKSSFGYTNISSNQFLANLRASQKPELLPVYTRSALFSFNNAKSWIIEPQLTYKTAIKKNKIEFLVGATAQQNDNDGKVINASGQPNDQQLRNIGSAASLSSTAADISTYKYNAGFVRLNYNFNDKYLINIAGRRDGSSRFGDKNKFHNFGSLAIGWIFSQEKLIIKYLPFLSFGKIRASYGTTGSDQIKNYLTLNAYNASNPGNPYQGVVSLLQNKVPNPYLQWEETRKLQGGIDIGVLNDKLLITANYVRNRSSNQLLDYNLPIITGYPSVATNFPALIENTAWEFIINSENIHINKFLWRSSFNLTIPKNKLVKFPNLSSSSYNSVLIVGQPLGVLKTHHFYGVDPATGIFLLTDQHGNPTTSPNDSDLSVMVSPFPKFYGGIQNTFQFKGFQLDFLIQFIKQKGFNFFDQGTAYGAIPGYFNSGKGNQPTNVLSRWRKPGDITNVERFSSDFSVYGYAGDLTYTDISFIRLKTISLSYQINNKIMHKAGLQDGKIYLSAQNVFTITSYKGLDPENLNLTSIPPLRVLTIGIQLGL